MQNTHPSTKLSSLRGQESEKGKTSNYVLDTYAVFALLQCEKGQEIVAELLEQGYVGRVRLYLSLISWGEVFYIVAREQGDTLAEEIIRDIDRLPVILCPVDRQRIVAAARIKAHYPISYADAFAVALAVELGAAVVTGDLEFRQVEPIVPVLWL